MTFMGELADIGVGDLLYLFGLRRQSGKLTIHANGDEVNLLLQDGKLVRVNSSNLALRLGRMLLRLGMLAPEQLRDALQEQETSSPNRPLGKILLDRGWLTAADLARCVEEQCIEVLSRVIATEQGTFVYSRAASIPPAAETIPLNPDRILLEAMRRTDEMAPLRGLLPAPTAPLLISERLDAAVDSLADAEILVAATLQSGAGSLDELTDQLAMDDLTLWRTVISLHERGLLIAGQHQFEPTPDPAFGIYGPTVLPTTPTTNGHHANGSEMVDFWG